MKKLLTKYINGNYNVLLFEDGTKVRYNDLDNLTPAFAESCDVCISAKCDGGCAFCYANCTPTGKHGNLNHPILDTLHRGQELAINGNDLSHPDLFPFLHRMRDKGVIVNITINQIHFIRLYNQIKQLVDDRLVWGVGISLSDSSDDKLFELMSTIPNSVLHTIDGLLTEQDISNIKNKPIKLLVLGYKKIGRGKPYYDAHKEEIEQNIERLSKCITSLGTILVSFDNLALEHLTMKNKISAEVWEKSFMGEEGEFTFYIDLVNETFAISSLEEIKVWNIKDTDTVDTMFNTVRNNRNN